MLAALLLLLPSPALAASLDNLEVGGVWGTPTATDATAAWWNPAGLAAGKGTRLMVEGAPTFATVTYARAEPHGGQDIYELSGVVPYAGVATDLGVEGLGLGAALAVPTVRGGAEVDEPGSGAYHMREGDSKAIWVLLGGGWDFHGVSIGVAGAYVRSTWTARVNSETLPDLAHAIEETGEETDYTDANLEDPRYGATLDFGELADDAFAFSAGVRWQATPQVAVGVAYVSGVTVDNAGDVEIALDCPPQEDTVGRFASESRGLCYATVNADASVGYTLPDRVQGGVVVTPTDALRIEAMGGWVHWSVYTDFVIAVENSTAEHEEARALMEQERLWARANVDSGWAGVDVKGRLGDRWTLGGRLVYDGAAVPDAALSTNNYDADALMLSGMAAWKPHEAVEIGLSWTHHFLQDRVVEDSGFGMTIEGETPEDRWNYPHANGTYGGTIDRIGVAVRAGF